MSQRKVSELRRSRSSSNIPQLSRNSRLPTRDSNQKDFARTLSRAGLEKRSVDRNFRPSANNLLGVSSSLGRPLGPGSSSLLRPSKGTTPLNRGGSKLGSKSPKSSARKDNRPISDKNWQYEQLVKVRNFVGREFPDLDYNNIKTGISLDFFIELTRNLFQLIDYRINITRENYITEVAVNLNRYQYPVSVKPSLMKTVNTPHCWPSVLAIFAWLVDFIKEINEEEEWTDSLHDLVDKTAFESFCFWNSGAQEDDFKDKIAIKLEQDLGRIFEVNKDDLINLDQKLANLQVISKEQKLKARNLAEEVESIQSNVEVINKKCDSYIKQKEEYEQALSKNLVEYSEKVRTLDQELSTISKTEEDLKNLVAAQPHSHAEKLQLTEQIKALKNTQTLKEEKLKQQRELADSCDYQLVQLKQEIESGAYKYNSIIDKLEIVNADFRRLHIRETGFAGTSVTQEFQQVKELVENFIKLLTDQHCTIQDELSEMVERNKLLENDIAVVKKTIEQLGATEMEYDLNLQHETKISNLEIDKVMETFNACRTKLEQIKKKKLATLTSLQQHVEEKQKKLYSVKSFKEDFKNKAMNFFTTISNTINSNLVAYQHEMRRVIEELSKLHKRERESRENLLQAIKQIKQKHLDKNL